MPRINDQRARLLFLNVGHFVDHLFMLIFAKAAFSAGLGFGLAASLTASRIFQASSSAKTVSYAVPEATGISPVIIGP